MKFYCGVDSMLNTSTDKRDQYEMICAAMNLKKLAMWPQIA